MDHVDHPSGFLALSPRNLRFSVPALSGLRALPAPGTVSSGARAACTRPKRRRAELLDAFLRDSARDGERVVALQVRARDVALFRSRGFRVDAFGSTFALELTKFTFGGTKRMKLRNRIKRARAAGVTVVELGRDRACPPGLWRRLAEISRAWLTTKGGHELDLLVGEMGEPVMRSAGCSWRSTGRSSRSVSSPTFRSGASGRACSTISPAGRRTRRPV